jgi:type IV secretion system protein VirD4
MARRVVTTRPVRRFFDLLDEFAALGHLAPIERAMTLMAGYEIQLWTILQDVHQLQATYGRARRHFLSNIAVLQVFGIKDHQSGRLASDLLGQRTVVFETTSQAMDSDRSGLIYAEHHSARPLLTPDEVRNLPQTRKLLFVAGMRPVVAGKLRYYVDREFAGLFEGV